MHMTTYSLENGRLCMTTEDNKTCLSVADTFAVLKIMLAGREEIMRARQQERDAQAREELRVSAAEDNMPTDRGGAHATSSVNVASELKGTGPIKPARGA